MELLAVIGVVGVLSALLFPALKRVQDGASRMKCVANLRQIYELSAVWSLDNGGWTPQANWYNTERSPYTTLRNCGLTDPTLKCLATKVTIPNYGINKLLVNDLPQPQWGPEPEEIYFHGHGKYQLASLTSKVIFFTETAAQTWSFRGGGSYLSSAEYLATPHGGSANVLYGDGHVGAVEKKDLQSATVWRVDAR